MIITPCGPQGTRKHPGPRMRGKPVVWSIDSFGDNHIEVTGNLALTSRLGVVSKQRWRDSTKSSGKGSFDTFFWSCVCLYREIHTIMADLNIDVSKLPTDIREKLAELELELSEGES